MTENTSVLNRHVRADQTKKRSVKMERMKEEAEDVGKVYRRGDRKRRGEPQEGGWEWGLDQRKNRKRARSGIGEGINQDRKKETSNQEKTRKGGVFQKSRGASSESR